MIKVDASFSQTAERPSEATSAVIQQQDYQVLNLAFLGSLLPGIIHNFATPLSGVLGATQLLEKRVANIDELMQDHENLNAAELAELQKQFERNRTNVDILARNAKHLADLLQVLVQRINRASGSHKDLYSINDILQAELRFLESHLGFKHKVKKQIVLAPNLSVVPLVYAHIASVLEEFVVGTLNVHDLARGLLEMDFITEETAAAVRLAVTARYQPQPVEIPSEPMASYLGRLREGGCTVALESDPIRRILDLHFPKPVRTY